MFMKLAYGFIETRGLTAAIDAADAMVKAAKVDIIKQQKIGGALVTILVEGELGACQAAVAAGSTAAEQLGELISAHVIPRPDDDIQLHYGSGTFYSTPPSQSSSKQVVKSTKKKIPTTKKTSAIDETTDLLDWMVAQKSGVNLNQIAEFLGQDSAGARREVKQLMDEECIEKVHQKYFFLSKRKKK